MVGQKITVVDARKLDILLNQTLFTGLYSVALSFACSVLMYNSGAFKPMLIWVFVNALFVLARWQFIFRAFGRISKPTESDYLKYQRLMLASWFVSGLIWGVGGYYFLPSSQSTELFVSFVTIYVGVTTGNIPNYSSSKMAGLLFVCPTLLGVAWRAYEYGYYFFVFITFVYIFFLATVIMRMTRTVGRAISLDLQNQALLNEVILEKEKAEQSTIEKSRFLAAASHDLRQPLNSLGMYLYSLRQKFTDEDSLKLPDLEGAETAHTALSNLFAALLEITRFDEGAVIAQPRLTTTTAVLEPIIDELKPLAKKKELWLKYEPSGSTINTDPVLLGRILRNIIDNAIKYTVSGGVTVTEKRHAQRVCLSIQDTGVGIPDSELGRIFNEYHQLNNQRRDRRQGIGLGLSIVQRMANLLQLEIEVKSKLDHGSEFQVWVPLDNQVAIDSSSDVEVMDELFGIQVLLVDDEPDVLLSTSTVLTSWGCEVSCADSIASAINAFDEANPDIVICDFRLQDDKNGIDLLRQLTESSSNSFAALLISGDSSLTLNKYEIPWTVLTKPVLPKTLYQAIRSAL